MFVRVHAWASVTKNRYISLLSEISSCICACKATGSPHYRKTTESVYVSSLHSRYCRVPWLLIHILLISSFSLQVLFRYYLPHSVAKPLIFTCLVSAHHTGSFPLSSYPSPSLIHKAPLSSSRTAYAFYSDCRHSCARSTRSLVFKRWSPLLCTGMVCGNSRVITATTHRTCTSSMYVCLLCIYW